MRPHVYIHLWTGRDEETRARSLEVAADVYRALSESGLEKAAVMRPIRTDATNELTTLKWLHYECLSLPADTPVLYLHLKGSSWRHGQRETPHVEDWRRLMLYFCVERWQEAVDRLRTYSAVGCNISMVHHPHFSGNFWWARAGALAMLPQPSYEWDRMEAEFWIGGVGREHMGSLHQSRVDHYFQPYPRERYAEAVVGTP